MLKLLSATPSPYVRKVRIALLEKGIPFELITEQPWSRDATAPRYNPLGKVPALMLPDGDIATGTVLGDLDLRYPRFDWRSAHPALVPLFERLSQRPSFAATVPTAQAFTDPVV